MEIQRFLFGFNPSAVVEDVALITLEKTAPRFVAPIKSYGDLKFSASKLSILGQKLCLNRGLYPNFGQIAAASVQKDEKAPVGVV